MGMNRRFVDLALAEFVTNISSVYLPELGFGFSNACCSDQQSFHEQGYPAVG